jgi:hypothetical protein
MHRYCALQHPLFCETKEESAAHCTRNPFTPTTLPGRGGFKTGCRKDQLQRAPSNNTLCRVSPVGTGTSSHVAA